MSAHSRNSASAIHRNHDRSSPVDLEQGGAVREPAASPAHVQNSQPDTVTIEKIGDFLEIDLRRVFVWIGAGLKLALLLAVLGAGAGAAFGLLSTRLYTVSSDVLIDPSNLQVITNDIYSQPGQMDGQVLTVANRMRIMGSGNVLSRVVKDLRLGDDREFYKPASAGFLSSLLGKTAATPNPELAALASLQKRVAINPNANSFIATLSVTSESTDKAIAISNAIVRVFREELARADSDGAGRAARSLDDRLDQLKREVQTADEKVEDYKRSHGLTTGENGQLVSSQAVTQLNGQIAAARSRVIDAQVSYNTLLKLGPDAVNGQSGVSTALAQLIDRAGGIQQQIEAQRMVFGDRHPSIVRMRAELSSVREQIASEIGRARNSAKAELDKANGALSQLQARMKQVEGTAFDDGSSQVALRELQRDAASKSAIYESFLSRARQITEREQINTTNIRVISPPTPPTGRSWPPSTLVLLIAGGMGGLLLGVMLSVVRGIIGDLRGTPEKTPANQPVAAPREPVENDTAPDWRPSYPPAQRQAPASTQPQPQPQPAVPQAEATESLFSQNIPSDEIRRPKPRPKSLLDY